MSDIINPFSRRNFIGASTAAAVSAAIIPGAHADPAEKKLKLALVGCGGRGTGAASQALKADKYIELVAMADIAPDQIEKSLQNLQNAVGAEKINMSDDRKFLGLDGIDKVLQTDVDVVILTTPPGFRPEHYE